jgi:stress-induced morphogen
MNDPSIENVIINRIQAEIPAVEVTLRDMTGTKDHWEAVIISVDFEGVRLIARQQRVYKALGELMAGPIHAFTMQTLTPTEAQERGITSSVKDTSQPSQSDDILITLS